jgi:hypothetical protein
MSTLSAALLILTTLFPFSSATAFEIHLLKNDKEAVSHAFSWLEHRRAERQASSSDEQAFDLMAQSLNEIETDRQLCETALVKSFSSKLIASGISPSSQHLHHLLILWRSKNRIDDLFFEIFEQGIETLDRFGRFRLKQPEPYEIRESIRLLQEKNISSFELSLIYSDFKNHSIDVPGCTIQRWFKAYDELTALAGEEEGIRLLNIAALQNGIIAPTEFALVEQYRTTGVESWNLELSRYLQNIKEIKNKSLGINPHGSAFLPNPLSSKIKDRKSGITFRQSLYYRYNSIQIRMIEDLLKKTFNRMDATKAEVIFTYKEGFETIPFSPMGQYFLARKLLRKDMDELNRSSFFAGVPVTHEDLVTAALETGLINGEVLDSVLKIDDLWNPEVKKWQKISNYAFRVTGTATIFLPPPYNVVSSMALVFLDGMIDRKSRKPSQADQDYDVF